MNENILHRGGCHCGKVRFEFEASGDLDISDCNCSICHKVGYLHFKIPKSEFKLLSGENYITTYSFNTGIAQHYFCKCCGVKSYYVPRSHPDKISINVRCIDPGTIKSKRIIPFDGQNWKKNIHKLN